MNRKFRVILTLSLVLNVLCIGLLAGYGASRAQQGWRGPERALTQFAETLPAEKRTVVEERMAARKALREVERVKKDAAHQALMEVLRAPEFDAVEFDTRAAALQAEFAKRGQEMGWMIKDIALKLNPQERAALADQLERSRKERSRR